MSRLQWGGEDSNLRVVCLIYSQVESPLSHRPKRKKPPSFPGGLDLPLSLDQLAAWWPLFMLTEEIGIRLIRARQQGSWAHDKRTNPRPRCGQGFDCARCGVLKHHLSQCPKARTLSSSGGRNRTNVSQVMSLSREPTPSPQYVARTPTGLGGRPDWVRATSSHYLGNQQGGS